jgi:hypothetical protein
MTMKTRLLLVVAILGTAFLLCGSGPPPAFADASHPWQSAGLRPSEPHAQPQNDAQDEVKEFKGKISKSNGRFVLDESSNGGTRTAPVFLSIGRSIHVVVIWTLRSRQTRAWAAPPSCLAGTLSGPPLVVNSAPACVLAELRTAPGIATAPSSNAAPNAVNTE